MSHILVLRHRIFLYNINNTLKYLYEYLIFVFITSAPKHGVQLRRLMFQEVNKK